MKKISFSQIKEIRKIYGDDWRIAIKKIVSENLEVSQIIEIKNLCGENWKDIIEGIYCLSLNFSKIIESINEGYISPIDILTDDMLSDYDYYYNSENYTYDYYNNIYHIDNLAYCDFYESYFLSDCINRVIDGERNSPLFYSDRAILNNSDVHRYQGDYYTTQGLAYCNLVYDCYGDIYHIDDLFYWESDGEYHHQEEQEEYLRPYHNDQNFKKIKFEKSKTKYTIGFEIEKEDIDVLQSINIQDFEEILPDWRKESDGSLCRQTGYELISPVYQFDINSIFKKIKESKTLVQHINAGISNNCGGHINLGHIDKTGSEVFGLVCGYMPLLYALYYGRVDKTYSKGKSNKDLIDDNDKYQAIKIHNDRIEFRIFSAVPNIETLKWRCELINLILKYPTNDIKKAFYYIETRFNKLLSKHYKGERKEKLKERLKNFSLKFENIVL